MTSPGPSARNEDRVHRFLRVASVSLPSASGAGDQRLAKSMIFPKSVISIYHPLNRFLGHFDTGKSDLIEQLPVQPTGSITTSRLLYRNSFSHYFFPQRLNQSQLASESNIGWLLFLIVQKAFL